MGGGVNYYPFHLGDYAAHTAHLEPMEDLAYRRMLDLYYRTEKPLSSDWRDIARLIRMRDYGDAIEAVLSEFFALTDDGLRHARCDAEIAKMQDKQAKAKASAQASVNARSANAQRTLNARPAAVELPTPIPTPTPKEDTHTKDSEPTAPPTAAGRACLLLRKSGIAGVSPGHPKLLALLAAGVSDEELTHAAQSAVAKGKGFAYAMGTLEAQRQEAATLALHKGPMPAKPVTVASDAADKTAAMLAEQAARKAEPPSDAIREKLKAAKGVAALAGLAVKVAA